MQPASVAQKLRSFMADTEGFVLGSRYLWLAALPLAVVFVGDIILEIASSRFGSVPLVEAPCGNGAKPLPGQIVIEAANRLWLMTSVIAILTVSCGAFVFAAREVLRLLSRDALLSVVKSLGLALGAYAIALTVLEGVDWARPASEILGHKVVQAAQECARELGGPLFTRMTLDGLIFAMTPPLALAAGTVVFAMIACLASSPVPPADAREEVHIWRRQSRRAERLLTLGATRDGHRISHLLDHLARVPLQGCRFGGRRREPQGLSIVGECLRRL
jgi:hypothetical protein